MGMNGINSYFPTNRKTPTMPFEGFRIDEKPQ